MQNVGVRPSRHGLSRHGITNFEVAHWNLGTAQLIEKALQRHEGMLASGGAFVVQTGQFTGRSPKDKYIVREPETETTVEWGSVNQPMPEQIFDQIYSRLMASWESDELFVQDCFAGADPEYTLPIRVVAQRAWHALFARQLFIRPDPGKTGGARAGIHGFLRSHFLQQFRKRWDAFEDLHRDQFQKAGGYCSGHRVCGRIEEIDLHDSELSAAGARVFPMHCSAQCGRATATVALFFGLSGTGKTTLSADPGPPADRRRRTWLERAAACSISKAAATPSASGYRARRSRRSGTPSASERCWRTW